MNNLVELLEMQAEIDALIQEEVSNLTVGEYIQLQEAGILNEAGLRDKLAALAPAYKTAKKFARKVGSITGVTKTTHGKRGTWIKNKKISVDNELKNTQPGFGSVQRKALGRKISREDLEKLKSQRKLHRGLRLATTGAATTGLGGATMAGLNAKEKAEAKAAWDALPAYQKALIRAKAAISGK